jgi:hypothetical protein
MSGLHTYFAMVDQTQARWPACLGTWRTLTKTAQTHKTRALLTHLNFAKPFFILVEL